jgi:Xaa-Pro dipeptidase
MHHRIAKLLKAHKLVVDISEDAMVEQNLTGPFLPHGLGHPLGLQVHDVAGFMQDDTGTHLAAPSQYPYLRCTRMLEPGMVLTIEPGLYFIDSLLLPWREGQFSKHFAWDRIDAMKPFGGIRIEDNIVIHDNRIENMTRDLKLA